MTELNGDVKKAYEEAFRWYDETNKIPAIHVSHYPYIGINHTIRVRNKEVFVRIAELCRDMPLDVHRALAFILVAKLYGRRTRKRDEAVYSEYASSDALHDRAAAVKRARGRKVVTTTKGETYDLDAIWDDLNWTYFRGFLPKPTLTWSAKKTYRILGHHDATHDHITISKTLDSREVPKFVVEYVLYHEMLHIFHPTEHGHNGRRYNHTPKFRADEEKFPLYTRAENWIERNVWKLKRAARRS